MTGSDDVSVIRDAVAEDDDAARTIAYRRSLRAARRGAVRRPGCGAGALCAVVDRCSWR